MAGPYLTPVMMATWNASIVPDVLKRVATAFYSCAYNANTSEKKEGGQKEKKRITTDVALYI